MEVGKIISGTEWYPSKLYGQDRPLVSVILPTFRRGKSGLFWKAAQSILRQTLQDIELIIVDDCSTDGTADQIKKLIDQDGRVSCLRHPHNVGLPAISCFEAFQKARADVLSFGFDDTEFHSHAIEALTDRLLSGEQQLVYGYVDMDFSNPITGQRVRAHGFGRGGAPQALLQSANFIANNAVVMRRELVHRVGWYDPHVAMVRLCDWDLWRRVSDAEWMQYEDIAAGIERGPSTTDSLGKTVLLDWWLSSEWMNLPRNEELLPENYEKYNVQAVPPHLSRQSKIALAELTASYSSKFWYQDEQESRSVFFSKLPAPSKTEGRILLVGNGFGPSSTLYFKNIPIEASQFIRTVTYQQWRENLPEQLVGASAVIFSRDLFEYEPWIEVAKKLNVPCYFFTDDNYIEIGKVEGGAFAAYTDDRIRNTLRSFAGVLVSTPPMVEYFLDHKLHDNVVLFPPICPPAITERPVDVEPRPLRLAFFGGPHRVAAFRREVMPDILRLSLDRPVDLIAVGMDVAELERFVQAEAEKKDERYQFRAIALTARNSYEHFLEQFVEAKVDALIHSPSDAPSSITRYKTHHMLINALAMQAVPIFGEEPPYADLDESSGAIICRRGGLSWYEALSYVAEDRTRRIEHLQKIKGYCDTHFGGRDNVMALQTIMRSNPVPGPIWREQRHQTLSLLRRTELSAAADRSQIEMFRELALPRDAEAEKRAIQDSLPWDEDASMARLLENCGWAPVEVVNNHDGMPSPVLSMVARINACFEAMAINVQSVQEFWGNGQFDDEGLSVEVGGDLRQVAYQDINIIGAQGRTLLAVALTISARPGNVGSITAALVAPDGEVMAVRRLSLLNIVSMVPTLFTLPKGVLIDGTPGWCVRVFAENAIDEVRLVHLVGKQATKGMPPVRRPFMVSVFER